MTFSSDYSAGRLTVHLAGELDHHEARGMMQAINELLDELMPRECVLELSQLRFMDSSGIALIVRLSQRMRQQGGRSWLEGASGQPKRVIEAAGVERLAPLALGR